MNIKSLLQVAVSKFRSPDEHGSNGAKGLAPLLGISHGSLSHKISPTYPGAHCSPEEVIRICRETGDLAPLQAMVAMVDHVMLPLVSAGDARQVQCLMASNVKEISDWLSVASAALASPARPSDNTMYELQRELLEMVAESMRVYAQLKAKHLAEAPALGSTAA